MTKKKAGSGGVILNLFRAILGTTVLSAKKYNCDF